MAKHFAVWNQLHRGGVDEVRILVASADPLQRQALVSALRIRNLEVLACTDAKLMLRAARLRAYPLVFFSWSLPGAGEVSVIETLNASSHAESSIHIALCTDDAESAAAAAAGVDDVFAGQVAGPALEARLDLLLRRAEAISQQTRLDGPWSSEANFRVLVESMGEGVAIRDSDGSITFANRNLGAILGIPPEKLCGMSLMDFLDPVHRKRYEEQILERSQNPSSNYEITLRSRDRRVVHAVISSTNLVDADGGSKGSALVVTDITELKRTQQDLQLTRFAVEHTSDAAFWTTADGRLLYANDAACSTLGHQFDDLVGANLLDIDDKLDEHTLAGLTYELRERGHVSYESIHKTKDGKTFPVEISANLKRFDDGSDGEIIFLFARDITQRKRTEAHLVHRALHDPLTNLPNRAMISDQIRRCLEFGRRRDGYQFAILFLDLDRFKPINDSYGHLVGDAVLQEVSKRLRDAVRLPDTVARLGGDEFVVLLEDIGGSEDASMVAERIRCSLLAPFDHEGLHLEISASIGISLGARASSPEDLLRSADVAMYRAKSAGGASVSLDISEHVERQEREARLEDELSEAIEGDGLELRFLPARTLDGHLLGLEALIRWRHEEHGLLGPGTFLDLARHGGMQKQFDRRFLALVDDAIAQLPHRHNSKLRLWLNFDPASLAQPDVIASLSRMTDMLPKGWHLALDLAEGELAKTAGTLRRTLATLAERGIEIWIDDVGSARSRLLQLLDGTVTGLKLDPSLLGGLGEGDDRLLRGFMALADGAGLEHLVEGVENPEIFDHLRELRCRMAQGFALGEPIKLEHALSELEED